MLYDLGFAVGVLVVWLVISFVVAMFVLAPLRRYKRRHREEERPGYIDLRPRL